MFSLDEMIADRKKYFSMMMKVGSSDTALQTCIALEDKYGLYGASPEVFTNYLSDEIKAAQLQLESDLLPCGHHKDAVVGSGVSQWCVACEAANRSTS